MFHMAIYGKKKLKMENLENFAEKKKKTKNIFLHIIN